MAMASETNSSVIYKKQINGVTGQIAKTIKHNRCPFCPTCAYSKDLPTMPLKKMYMSKDNQFHIVGSTHIIRTARRRQE